jgi:predicted transcriptional regulator
MKNLTLDDYIQENLKKPGFKKAWKASEIQYQTVRQLIRERLRQNLSQRKLAQKAHTTQAVLSRIENLSVNPSINLLDKIAQALGKKLQIKLA